MNQGEQLELAAMPARLFACTPSKLTTFDCPRRYRMVYLDRPRPPRGGPWAHNTMGAVVHVALRQWFDLPLAGRTPEAGAALVVSNWQHDGFCDEAQSALWRGRSAAWVRQYLMQVDPQLDPPGLERTVAAPTERLALSGRVDRIDEREGELVIVDYKTGRSIPTTDDARGSLALAIYVLGARRTLRRPCHRVELHHLPSGTVASFEHTDESLGRHRARAQEVAAEIVTRTDTLESFGPADAASQQWRAGADELFPAVTGAQCSWCDMRRNCPAGQAASKSRPPWDGLPQAH